MTAVQAGLGGLIWVSLAPIFYSAMNASAKLAGTHASVWQIGFFRFGLGLVLMPVIARTLGLSIWGRQRFLLTLRGFCGAITFLLLVAAFQRITLSMATVLFYLYPAFTALLSPWVAGEPTAKKAWPFIFGAFIGTTLILWPDESVGSLGSGHLFALIGSVMCAITILLVRRLGKENNIYTLYFYLCLAGILASSGPLLFIQERPVLPGQEAAWIDVAAVALFSVVAQLTLNQALVRIPADKVTVIMTAEVPLVACFGVIYLGEPFGWRLMVGALLIFGCGIGINLRLAMKKKR